jgi:hypothetical protein
MASTERVGPSSTRCPNRSAGLGPEVHDARNNERQACGRRRDGEPAVHEPEWRVRRPEGGMGGSSDDPPLSLLYIWLAVLEDGEGGFD